MTDLNGANGFRLDGLNCQSAGGQSGYSVSGGGDVNGDGYVDLIVGDPNCRAGGSGYLYPGNK